MFRYSREFKTAFKISIPIMMGYTVLGFAFGLLLVSFGYAWYFALLLSIFVYTGALQFLAINFFNVKAGFIDIAIASWFINIRQSFYGLSLLKRFKKSGKLKPYLIFGLTDEVYALLTTIKDDEQLKKHWYYFFVCALSQLYWVVGTVLGSIIGSNIKFNTAGLEFSLTALFVVLCIEQYKNLKKKAPFLIGAITSVIAFLIVPKDKVLITAIAMSLILLFVFKRKVEDE